MSTVYLAIQLSVGREVALKVMSPVLNADPVFSERFQREANIVGQLSHPNIVSIYDIGRYKSLNYIAMDYLPGGTVHEKMRDGLEAAEVLTVIKEVAKALDVAHTKGYVHRDVKPENILFREDGTAVLTDFGVAKTTSAASKVTNAGTVVGTPHYMSPEQARGHPIDGRSDIYSLGIVFYEMLTGVVPYQAEEAVAIAIKHLTAPVPTLPGQHAVYQGVLNRLLAKNANDRFQRGAEIVEAITAIEETLGGYPARRTPQTNPSDMNVMALFKALLLTSFAVLRIKLSQMGAGVFNWRWTPNRGFFRHPDAKVTEVRTEVDTGENQRNTVVSTRIRKAAHYQEMSSRKLGIVTRGFALLFTASIVWSALCVGLVRFNAPLDQYLPSGLEEFVYSTAASIEGYAERFSRLESAEEQNFASSRPSSASIQNQDFDLLEVEQPDRQSSAHDVNVEEPIPNASPIAKSRYALSVATEPADALIRILNIREKYRDGIELESGRYHLEVSKPGYATHRQWVSLRGGDLTVEHQLEPLHTPGEVLFDTLANGGKGPEMIVIVPGRFTMGQKGEAHLSPERDVHIIRKFAIGKYEVTFADYQQFANATDAAIPDDNRWGQGSRPVINVSWHDAMAYTTWLSEQTGRTYRLPTEAEWEYSARAGSSAANWWGDGAASDRANCKRGCDSDYTGLLSSKTAPVGSFPPNPFGLHDTAGNVAEWVLDCYQNHYIGAPTDGSAVAAENCSSRLVRGGAARDSYTELFSYAREKESAATKSDMIGFRVVREFDY